MELVVFWGKRCDFRVDGKALDFCAGDVPLAAAVREFDVRREVLYSLPSGLLAQIEHLLHALPSALVGDLRVCPDDFSAGERDSEAHGGKKVTRHRASIKVQEGIRQGHGRMERDIQPGAEAGEHRLGLGLVWRQLIGSLHLRECPPGAAGKVDGLCDFFPCRHEAHSGGILGEQGSGETCFRNDSAVPPHLDPYADLPLIIAGAIGLPSPKIIRYRPGPRSRRNLPPGVRAIQSRAAHR
ncbi:MAG: hypothetical protein WCP55_24880, partial [Lentisphaerota bacterium]